MIKPEIQTDSVCLSNTTIQYLHNRCQLNKNKPYLVMLHGFPENSWSYRYYLTHLVDNYQVIAPDLPGYNFSPGFKSVYDYTMENLMACLAEFLQKICQNNKVTIVAHDWGGAIAWPLAAFYPQHLDKLIIVNAAHPSAFTREMAVNEKQQKRSDYITDLISDYAYEWVSENYFYRLKRLYGGLFENFEDEYTQRLIQQWKHKPSMENAFAYYKNMPFLATKRYKSSESIKIPNIRVNIPTVVLWGIKDTAFVPEVLDGLDKWVTDMKVVRYQQADHWLMHQQADDIIRQIKAFC